MHYRALDLPPEFGSGGANRCDVILVKYDVTYRNSLVPVFLTSCSVCGAQCAASSSP